MKKASPMLLLLVLVLVGCGGTIPKSDVYSDATRFVEEEINAMGYEMTDISAESMTDIGQDDQGRYIVEGTVWTLEDYGEFYYDYTMIMSLDGDYWEYEVDFN